MVIFKARLKFLPDIIFFKKGFCFHVTVYLQYFVFYPQVTSILTLTLKCSLQFSSFMKTSKDQTAEPQNEFLPLRKNLSMAAMLCEERLMRIDGIITSVSVCVCICFRKDFCFSLFSSPWQAFPCLSLPLSLSLFTSDVCLPITLSTASNEHYSKKVNKYNCLHLGKTTAAAFVPLWLIMNHISMTFCNWPHFFFLLVSNHLIVGDFGWLFHIIIYHYFPHKKSCFHFELWTVKVGNVQLLVMTFSNPH